jgi:hypothetical protein
VREKKGTARGRTPRPSKLASEPLPVPKTPPPKALPAKAHPAKAASPARVKDAAQAAAPPKAPGTPAPVNPKHAPVNDLLVFLDFVEKHPVGSVVTATIESFSSHGAYAMAGPARCYVPLRFMGNPPPRSARDVVKLGDERPLVIVSFNGARRGIDAALEGFEPADVVRVPAATKARKRAKKTATPELAEVLAPAILPVAKKATGRKTRKAAEPAPEKLEKVETLDVVELQPAPPPASPPLDEVPKPKKATRKKAAAAPAPAKAATKATKVTEVTKVTKVTKAKRAAAPAKTSAAEPPPASDPAPVKAAKKTRAKKVAAPG